MPRVKHVRQTPEQKLKSARDYLSNNDHNAADFEQHYESIYELCEIVDKSAVDAKLFQNVWAMLHVRCTRQKRSHRGRHSLANQEIFSASDTDKAHPFSWTQKYWKYQRRLQQSAAMPPPATHPRHQPFQLPGPDGNMIDHARCRERWNMLRILQFDLLYMSFRTEMSQDIRKARFWQLTPEGRMLKNLSDQKVIEDLGANWDSIAQVTEATKIQQMEPFGVDLFMFEGCERSEYSSFRHLKEVEQEKIRDMAQRRPKLGIQDRKTYDRLRGKLLNEMSKYETLIKSFAEEEASYTDRRLATAKSKGLSQLAQPLNAPDHVTPIGEKAKGLLTSAILRENIENERSQLIHDAQIWAFVREIDQETRAKNFFSLEAWWTRRGLLRKDSSSSDSSGPHQPPGGGMISTDQDSPIRERPIIGHPIEDPNRNESEEGNAALAGWADGPGNPTDYFPVAANRHHSLNESSVDGSSSNQLFDVGSGMLVPPEVLGHSFVGVHDNDGARTNSLIRHDETRHVNDAQIAEGGDFRGVNEQGDGKALRCESKFTDRLTGSATGLNVRGVVVTSAAPTTSGALTAPPITSSQPSFSTRNIVQAEAASEKMPISITSSAVEMRQAPVMTTSAVKPGPLISTTRPNSPAKRPAESDLNPSAKRLFPKWDPHRYTSTARQIPEPPIDPVDPPLSSTAVSSVSRALSDQLNPPHKRPAPVAPSSPRKKHIPAGLPGLNSISLVAHASSQEAQPRSLSQTSSIKESARGGIDLPKTPITPTFRSPRKAPAPPTDQQPQEKADELTEPPLSADDIFAMGFPKIFGTQETISGGLGAKAAEQSSSRLPVEPNPLNLPALSRGNSPAPAFGATAWAKPNLAPGQFGFGKPSFPQHPQPNQSPQNVPPRLTPPPNPPPPRSPPPFPTIHPSAPSPPSTTRSSLPIASLSTIRELGLPPDKDDDSSDDEAYPYKSKTVSDFQRALRAHAHDARDVDPEADANEGNLYVREEKQWKNPPRNPFAPYARPTDPRYFSFSDRLAQDAREEREEKLEAARAELEAEEDEDVDSELDSDNDDDDEDLGDDDDLFNGNNPPPPVLPATLPASLGTTAQPRQMINTPGWTQTQASITGTGEAWTRPGGFGVSTRGRVSSPLDGDDGTAELAEELEGQLDADAAAAEEDHAGHKYHEDDVKYDEEYHNEGDGEEDDDASLYPDRAAVQERPPRDDQQQDNGGVKGGEGEEGNEDRSIDYLFEDDAEKVEERVDKQEMDSLFDDDGGDEDLIDWGEDDVEESVG